MTFDPTTPVFQTWGKIPRLNRDIVITEKIDGTNAAIGVLDDGTVYAQSRKKLITPEQDNAGFARWVSENEETLREFLGPGLHFGEWWGKGIQRGYGQDQKFFSLFNTSRWADVVPTIDPLVLAGVRVVPTLYEGPFDQEIINDTLGLLALVGSIAAPGFMDPEGIIIFHTAANSMFKVTIKDDEKPKGSSE
jgi:hypothetical protein